MATPTASYTPRLNSFTASMVEKLARNLWSSKGYKNPIAVFKKGFIENANEIEEVYVARVQALAQDFTGSTTLDRVLPDITTQYHKQEYGKLFTATVSDKQARRAFVNGGGVKRLADEILKQLDTGYQYDEYVNFKLGLDRFITGLPVTANVSVTAVTDEASAKKFVKAVKTALGKMQFRSTTYATVETNSTMEDMVLVTTPDIIAEVDVELLASAFNMSKAELPTKVVLIDSFENANYMGVLMDKNGLQFYDTLYNMETQRNAQGMFTNYHLNVEKIISTSNLYNGAVFDATV